MKDLAVTPPLFKETVFDDPSVRDLFRVGVIDIGSNSVRLVVFDGAARSPAYFFNEKIMCGLGVGLSSPPGILYLHEKGHDLEVWNRSVDKASKLLNNRLTINHLNFDDLKKNLKANDIIVSMLPASMHYDIAKLAIYKKCHLITSSYFDNKYAELETQFIKNNCLFLNETGLDPGIDHLLSHKLFHQFKRSISPQLVDEISILIKEEDCSKTRTS